MKKIISILMTVVVLFGFCIIPSSAEAVFTDVSASDWFNEAVLKIKEMGYMNGTSSDTFSPYDAVSRAMAVQVLYNMSGESAEYSPYFTDVPEKAWFASAVCWAKEKGIANGTSDSNFSPDLLMTREQLACFIDRFITAYDIALPINEQYEYSDMENASEWAAQAVSCMAKYRIMSPRSFTFFCPDATVSRGEFATFVLSMKGETELSIDKSLHVQLIYTMTSSAYLEKGQSVSVKGVLYPEKPTDTHITYSSSDPSVARVDAEGNVTALSKGTVTVTITARDGGYKAYSTVYVSTLPAINLGTASGDGIYNSTADNSGMAPIYTITGAVVDPNKPMVALTYDDGPHRTYTNQILDTLEKYGAAATFFELGNRAVSCGDILRREVALGCEVANHSYDHPNLSTLSAGGVANQIGKTNQIIYDACGVWPRLVRPPYGSNNSTVRNNVGAPIIIWSIDTLDWKYRDASYVTSVIRNQVHDGSVILMHSLYASTARATEIIVPWLLSQGYQLVTVSQLAKAKGVDMQNGRVYYSF